MVRRRVCPISPDNLVKTKIGVEQMDFTAP